MKKNPLNLKTKYSGSKRYDYSEVRLSDDSINSLPTTRQLKKATGKVGNHLRRENEMRRAALDFKFEGPHEGKSKKDQDYTVYWKRAAEEWRGKAKGALRARAKANPATAELRAEIADLAESIANRAKSNGRRIKKSR